MNHTDWREPVTREEDPEHLADTHVETLIDGGDDYDAFIVSLAREHPMAWILEQPQFSEGASESGLLGFGSYKNKVEGAVA